TTLLRYCGDAKCDGDESKAASGSFCPADCIVSQGKKVDIVIYVIIGLVILGGALFFFMR
ncbi:MAG: hypothetical protein HZB68_05415, partial [Candidatus Aenigmarchaeota archaeon]|nr:hypothetical protein [Candidatus Aenigmarchaeota archaeon]